MAEINKIQQDRTPARTRAIWLANPRNSRMRDYTYGVAAVRPLIGNNEDIARFDMAMTVAAGEVDPKEINRPHRAGELRYTAEACRTLLLWVWSRTPDQVKFTAAATREVYKQAQAIGSRYVDDPPLILSADVRVKIARISVALAARLFSSSADYESIVVKPEHVVAAVAFMDQVYSLKGFGYRERSEELLADAATGLAHADSIEQYLAQHEGLAKFLRSNSTFRRPDLEEILNLPRETANAVINTLWQARMVRKEGGNVRVEPVLHDILRRT
jgi:hypothetical protein